MIIIPQNIITTSYLHIILYTALKYYIIIIYNLYMNIYTLYTLK
jgi:hypothetical protein